MVVLCCQAAVASDPAPHLDIFVLSDTPQQNYRFISTPAYPNLGYVAPQPDLVVNHIKSVAIGVSVEFSSRPDEANEFSKTFPGNSADRR